MVVIKFNNDDDGGGWQPLAIRLNVERQFSNTLYKRHYFVFKIVHILLHRANVI